MKNAHSLRDHPMGQAQASQCVEGKAACTSADGGWHPERVEQENPKRNLKEGQGDSARDFGSNWRRFDASYAADR